MSEKKPAIRIGDRLVGGGAPPFIIAEIAQAHDGSLGMAHSYIDAVAAAGCDAIKFQTHIADAESTLDEPFRVKFSKQDETRYAYWCRMEFTAEQWAGLAQHCRDKSLLFLSSAFSEAAVKLLVALEMPAWKVGSGEFGSFGMIEAMADTGCPILYSTGMSRLAETSKAVDWFRARKIDFALFQCTSQYPTPLEKVGLNVIDAYRAFDCPVGLSDHSGTIYPAIAAMARGVDIVEVHAVFDRTMFGPDAVVSLTPTELADLTKARDAFVVMDGNPVDKDAVADELSGMRYMFAKSLAPVRDLPKGTVLTGDMLTVKKPATGLPPNKIDTVIGRCLVTDVPANRLLSEEHLADEDKA
jgi:N-acetylneuraminate synthase